MKDITRIHIAKVPYNVELSAKKELEKYIAALEAYTNDNELLEDIEIRMTELLLERGVKQEDVISDADVKAIREQLGEPREFMTDEATLEVDAELLTKDSGRKLYRNLDTALLGGVLSGIASYFRVNALWIRLIFIVLSFMSFGVFVLLYIVLCLIIPPARTAAEKLQMTGRPVTLASIRKLNESGAGVDLEKRARTLKRIATTIIGIGGIGGALASVSLMVAFGFRLGGGDYYSGNLDSFAPYQLTIILGFVAGALLTILFLLIAFAAFAQKFNKRIWISGIVIIALGLSSFGVAVISGTYQGRLQYEEVLRNTIDTSIKLPDNFSSAKSLAVDVPDTANVVYVADDTATSIKEHALKGAPQANVTIENGIVRVKLAHSHQKNAIAGTTVTIYGPRLDSIVMSNGYASYSAATQSNLKVEVYNAASLRLNGSRIDTLTVKTDGTAQLSADEAAVMAVRVSVYGESSVNLGNIKTLDVTNPDVCASNQVTQLSVGNIVSTTYTHNGIEVAATSRDEPCLRVEFQSDNVGGYGYRDSSRHY